MQSLIRVAVLVVLAAIVASLGTALLHLSRGGRGNEEESRKLARALTVRIALSLALFALLMLAWRMGLIHPHGMQPDTQAPLSEGTAAPAWLRSTDRRPT